MADIDVKLNAKGDLDKEALAASKAMAAIAEEEKRVSQLADKLGTSDLKKVSKALQQIKRESTAASKAQEQMLKREAKARMQAADRIRKESEAAAKQKLDLLKRENERRREGVDIADKLLQGDVKGIAELNLAVGAALGLAAGFAAAQAAALGLAGAVGKMAAEAGANKRSAEAMFRVLEGSNAEKALAAVDAASEAMGVSLEKGRERFIKFRKAGADNSVSVALAKLTADLDAVDPSGALAEDAVAKVLAKKKDDGTADLEAMRDEMAKLADQAGVAGDGATAAAARFGTVGGALTSIDNSKTELLERIWERIGGTVDEVAGKVAKVVDEFVKSERGQEVIDDLGAAFDALGEAADKLIPYIGDVISGFAAFIRVGSELASAIVLLPEIFGALGDAVTDVLQDFFGLSEGVASAITSVVGAILDPLGIVSDGMPSVATDMIDGLISGLSPSKLISHMKGLASSALGTFKGVLGIASPSKVFAEVGADMGEGTRMGFADKLQTLPDLAKGAVNDVAATPALELPAPVLAPAGAFSAAPATQAPATQAPGQFGSVGDITINVSGAGDPEAVASSVRRELQALLSAERLAKGAAA